MAKKVVKQSPHLRVRIEPKLLARLERAREANGSTLTGEIVTRLEQSFEAQDRITLVKEAYEKMVEDFRRSTDNRLAELERERDRVKEEFRKDFELARAKLREETRHLEDEIDKLEDQVELHKAASAVVDTLMGDHAATREAVRGVAVLLAANPDWAASSDGVRNVTQAAVATIKAAADKGEQ